MRRFLSYTVFLVWLGYSVRSQLIVTCPNYAVTYHDTCYIFGFGESMTYSQAEVYCSQHNAHIVHVKTKEENTFLKNYMIRLPRSENYWMGMTDKQNEHYWRWPDTDTAVSFFDWAPGDPDNVAVDEDCAVFWTQPGYQWADVPCDTFKAEPVCEIRQTPSQT